MEQPVYLISLPDWQWQPAPKATLEFQTDIEAMTIKGLIKYDASDPESVAQKEDLLAALQGVWAAVEAMSCG